MLATRFVTPLMVGAGNGSAWMSTDAIRVNGNVRAEIGDISSLVESVRARGIIEPLIVSPDGWLLAGRRRLAAARAAGLSQVPVRVLDVPDRRTALEIGLIENVQRADLDPLSRARAYHALVREHGATVEEVAALVGQGAGHVYQHLRLLDLHPDVQQALYARAISFADARALAPLELADQAAVLQEIRTSPKPLSSRQVKARVEARRVMRLVKSNVPDEPKVPNEPKLLDCYAALFEAGDVTAKGASQAPAANPLDELNALIAEMIAAAHGEDEVRSWARRLSRILEALRAQCERGKSSAVQERLL